MGTYLVWVGVMVVVAIFGVGIGMLLAGPSGWIPGRTREGEKQDHTGG